MRRTFEPEVAVDLLAETFAAAFARRRSPLAGNIELTRRQLLATSTNPRTLYARLYAAGGSPAEVFTEIGDTLRSRPAPATLRAALYRALALVPGVRLVGRVTDSVGRHGTAVGLCTTASRMS